MTIYQAVEEQEKLQARIIKSQRGSKLYNALVKKLVLVQRSINEYDEQEQLYET